MPRNPLLTTLRAMILNRLRLRLDSRGDPATPPADAWDLYVRSSDSALVAKDSSGTVTDLTAGGGGGTMDHAALTSNLAWTSSAHTSTANRLAGFTSGGAAEATTVSTGLTHSAGALAVDFGSTATTACVGNDSRLSNARTPTAHATSHQPGGSDAMAVDAAAATGSLRTIGTSGTSACAGNDARLSDSRTPTAHASSHLDGGSDALLDTSRTNSKGIQLSSVGLVGVDMMAILGAYHYSFADYVGNTQYSHGQASLSALGTPGASGGLHNRRTGTASTGVQQSSRLHLLAYGAVLCLRFRFPTTIAARRILIGLSSANPTDTDTVNGSYIGWMYSSVRGDAGWMPCSRDGVTQTLGAAGAALAADVEYMAVIRHVKGGSSVDLEMHNLTAGTVSTATVSATLPATSTALGHLMVAYNQGVDKGFDVLSQRCWTET